MKLFLRKEELIRFASARIKFLRWLFVFKLNRMLHVYCLFYTSSSLRLQFLKVKHWIQQGFAPEPAERSALFGRSRAEKLEYLFWLSVPKLKMRPEQTPEIQAAQKFLKPRLAINFRCSGVLTFSARYKTTTVLRGAYNQGFSATCFVILNDIPLQSWKSNWTIKAKNFWLVRWKLFVN